jgi:hypothetical protein
MQNYKDLVLENQIGSMQIAQPIQDGTSKIDKYPLDVVEKLGKYQFIYDYQIPSMWTTLLPQNIMLGGSLINQSLMEKEGESNPNETYNFDGDGTGGLKNLNLSALFPQPVRVNSEPQVGTFSKGNIVNVLRFDGYNAIIQNPNFVESDPNAPKVGFFSNFGDLKKQKEFSIPKDYLRKVDDTLAITVSTGIQYGGNMKPQPVITVKPIYDTTLEQNATFVLTKDFNYISGYIPRVCPPNELCKGGMVEQYSVLKSGTKVSGRLFSKYIQGFSGGIESAYRPDRQENVLKVEGYGSQGSIEIPIEYLTRFIVTVVSLVDKKTGKCNETGLIQTMEYNPCRVSAVKGETYKGYIADGSFYTTDGKTFLPINEYRIIEENSGAVVPVKNDNKNLLMIVGAFLVGYILFNKKTPSN